MASGATQGQSKSQSRRANSDPQPPPCDLLKYYIYTKVRQSKGQRAKIYHINQEGYVALACEALYLYVKNKGKAAKAIHIALAAVVYSDHVYDI